MKLKINCLILLCFVIATVIPNGCLSDGLTPFIVGGQESVPHAWPSQVLVTFNYKTNFTFGSHGTETVPVSSRCGGTLLNRNHILTAAHCISKEFTVTKFNQNWTIPVTPNKYYPTYESMYNVYAGVHNIQFLNNPSIMPSVTKKLNVTKLVPHESYSSLTKLNDIAIFEVTPVTENDVIKYVTLPKQSTLIPKADEKVNVSGWGLLSEKGVAPTVLYTVQLAVYDPKSCANVLPSRPKSWTKQICIGELKGGKDTCQGDSGGGVYWLDPLTKKYTVVGVVSYGDGCARPNSPGIYTRVSAFSNWISGKI